MAEWEAKCASARLSITELQNEKMFIIQISYTVLSEALDQMMRSGCALDVHFALHNATRNPNPYLLPVTAQRVSRSAREPFVW